MDWAEERAWKWDGSAEGGFNPDVQSRVQSLAALLREVDTEACNAERAAWYESEVLRSNDARRAAWREQTLAEVRRVVEEFMADVDEVKKKGLISEQHGWGRRAACLEILSRLEALK